MGEWAGMSRGRELGVTLACCVDEEDYFLIVDILQHVKHLSTHSGLWSLAGRTRTVWRMSDAANCVAWKLIGDDVTAIMM